MRTPSITIVLAVSVLAACGGVDNGLSSSTPMSVAPPIAAPASGTGAISIPAMSPRNANAAARTQEGAPHSALSAAQPASIVYTPSGASCLVVTNQSPPTCSFYIDLNNDGHDFAINESIGVTGCSKYTGYVFGSVTLSSSSVMLPGGIVDGVTDGWAAALNKGDLIGSETHFSNAESIMTDFKQSLRSNACGSYDYGYWLNKIAYLGLKFPILGETHYGWAQLSVTLSTGWPNLRLVTAMTGYAYQTKAGKSIMAGQM